MYHPQLRTALRANCALSCLVPISSQDATLVSQVLSLVGNALWKVSVDSLWWGKNKIIVFFFFCQALQACLRENRAARARTEREMEDSSLPWSLHTLPTILALAEAWRREAGKKEQVHVVLLLEEYSASERAVLRSLFHSLTEATSQEPFRSSLAFGVVLWASSETEMEADLFDHLFWTRYPFLPASTMLKNVLFAALVEPTLPFVLPAPIYTWILQHFTNESHSLAWLLHVLNAVTVSFFSTTAGSWVLSPQETAPDGCESELQRLFPPGTKSVLKEWSQQLDQWKQYRAGRVEAFLVLWRLLLRWNPVKTRSLLEEYGEYLTLSAVGRFDQHVRTAIVSEAVACTPEELQRRFDAVLEEMRLLATGSQPVFVARALHELEQAALPANAEQQQQQPQEQHPAQAHAVAVAASDEYVLKKPKDLLLEPSRGSNNPNLRRSSSAAHGLSRRDSLSSSIVGVGDDRKVASLLRCLEHLLSELSPPTLARFPLMPYCVFPADTNMSALLWGDHRRQVLAQLDKPSWKCVCCRSSGGVLNDRKKTRKETESESVESHEDICLAFSFVPRGGRVDFGEWELYFCNKIGMETSSKVKSLV